MSLSNKDVARAWSQGRGAQSGHMFTDGRRLYSYALLIGCTGEASIKLLRWYRGARKGWQRSHYVSMTTSQHVGVALGYADLVIEDWDLDDKWE